VATIKTAAGGLLDLLEMNLLSTLDRLLLRRSDLSRYRYLMNRVGQCDVRTDAAFQRTFNGLYMVRRGAPWRKAFYELFEAEKATGTKSFNHVLIAIHEATGRVEASFASKLLATVHPEMPVYDSWVRANLSLKARTGPASQRISALCDDYAHIAGVYARIIRQLVYAHIRASFDAALPDLSDLGDVKKIDLLLWQSRSR